jgi:uncharacterized MAPEG superfamily protein
MLAFIEKAYQILEPNLVHVPLLFSAKGALVAMFILVYISKYIQIGLSFLLLARYDQVQASFRIGLKKGGKDSWQERTVQRAFSAHENHWEAFIGFSVATLLALQNVKDTAELDVLVNAFLLVRAAYNVVYILAFNVPLSLIRSSVWLAGAVIIFKIFSLSVGDMTYSA